MENNTDSSYKSDEEDKLEYTMPQHEAQRLINIRKEALSSKEYAYPKPGDGLEIPLISEDRADEFKLTIRQGGIVLSKKVTTQLREKNTNTILVRLDLGNKPHVNPDGTRLNCPHIHIYKEGYGDRYAEPLPKDIFTNPDNVSITFKEFLKYCNVTKNFKINGEIGLW